MTSQALQNPLLLLIITAFFFATRTTVFGVGIIEQTSELYGYNACHGDIGDPLASLPLSFSANKLFISVDVGVLKEAGKAHEEK